MNKVLASLLVVGLVAVGGAAAGPTHAAALKGSPFSGKFVGAVPGTGILWPITIKGNGAVSADVSERPSKVTVTWGSFSGTVDEDGLMNCSGIEFVRVDGGGFETRVIDFKANVRLTQLGGIEGTFGTGEELIWLEHATTKKK